MNKHKLTIAIITMNRAEQLSEAIHSCLASKLPAGTDFVIVDNASTDNTKEMVETIIANNPGYKFTYYYSPVNVGVGGGRNEAFARSTGKYIYFLDDDAVIAPECYNTFFEKCIDLMEKNKDVASLSTRIFDTICGNDRNVKGVFAEDELVDIISWRGGSHFLQRNLISTPLYLNIRYGCEELMPSICAWDRGFRNVYYDGVNIIHQPRINKWEKGTDDRLQVLYLYNSMHYATYRLLYPCIFYPILKLSLKRRCKIYLSDEKNNYAKCLKLAQEVIDANPTDKISVNTVLKLWRKFGLKIF